jgi:hypothetical protein
MQVYHSTRKMTKHKPGRYSAEISELTAGGRQPLVSQIYPDSVDQGFILVEDETGREVRMVQSNTEYDREGDMMWISFTSDKRDVAQLKILPIEITVYND